MRPFLILTLILAGCALAALPPSAAQGQCPSCGVPFFAGPVAPANLPFEPRWEWRMAGEEYTLWRNGSQVGNYLPGEGFFLRLGPGRWENKPSNLPVALPEGAAAQIEAALKKRCKCSEGCKCGRKCTCAKKKEKCSKGCTCGTKVIGKPDKAAEQPGEELTAPTQDFGVETEKISPVERCSINGQTVTFAQLLEVLEEAVGKPDKPDAIPDDSKMPSLSVMGGTTEQRQKAHDDLAAPQFAAWRENVLYQEYDADSPMLKCGFKVSSDHPTIYFQAPDGTVLARVDRYDGPQTWEAVRKTDPSYDPSKDPDPTRPKPAPAPSPDDGGGASGGAIAAIVGGLLFFGLFSLGCLVGFVLFLRWLLRPKVA